MTAPAPLLCLHVFHTHFHIHPIAISEIILHVDAARGDCVSGVGYVLQGEVSHSGRRPFYGTYTSMEAEFYALVEGLRVASVRSDSREYCEAYSDCRPLVDKMCGSEQCRDDWRDYYDSCHWLLGKFDGWELNNCDRSHNEDAHELAREALHKGRKSSR